VVTILTAVLLMNQSIWLQKKEKLIDKGQSPAGIALIFLMA